MPVVNPATEEVIAEVAAATRDDVDARRRGGARGADGPVGQDVGARARPADLEARRAADGAGRRGRAPRDAPQRQADHRVAAHRDPDGRRVPAVLRRLGRQDPRRDDSGEGQRASSTRCASRSASSPRSCRGTFRCCSRCGRSRRRWRRGNTVILKPASQTPLTALALGELALEVGFPPGVLNVVTGSGSDGRPGASSSIPASTRSRSPATRRPARASCGRAAETLKHITLELGGKSPNIVFADADLDAAVRGATVGIFYGKGEVCAAGSRLLVDKSIKDQFIAQGRRADEEDGRRAIRSIPKTRLGRDLVEGPARARAELRRTSRRREGASLVAGGSARRHRHRQGLLHAADGVRRRHAAR